MKQQKIAHIKFSAHISEINKMEGQVHCTSFPKTK